MSSIDLRIQEINWGLHYIFPGLNLNTFEELNGRAHDIELRMTLKEYQQSLVYETHKDEDIEEI